MKIVEIIGDGRRVVAVELGEQVTMNEVIQFCIKERILEQDQDGYHYGVKIPRRKPGFFTRTELAFLMANTCWW